MNIALPTKDTPGYLRRQKQALQIKQEIEKVGMTPESIDKLLELFLPFVSEPVDRNLAREELLDMSQAQYQEALDKITGNKKENPTKAESVTHLPDSISQE